MVEMLSTNTSLLGLKMLISNEEILGVISFVRKSFWKAILTSKTLQLLHLAFPLSEDSSIEFLKVIVASLTPNSIGYQSNTSLRTLFMNVFVLYHKDYKDNILKSLIKAFTNMLERNKTLTTIQIPNFVVSTEDIIEVLYALEVNQSISNIILESDYKLPYPWQMGRYREFSREEVFSRLLKMIKFRNDHGNALSTVDVRGTSLEETQYDVHIQGALKKKYYSDGSHGEFFVRPKSCRVFLCGFPEAGTKFD